MGVILHSFLEIDIGSGLPPFRDVGNIRVFNEAEFFVWRDPEFFDALSGRYSLEKGVPPLIAPPFPPRGLPDPVDPRVEARYHLYVVDSPSCEHVELFAPVTPCCISRAAVERLQLKTVSVQARAWGDRSGRFARIDRVVNPDWHSASWLYLHELQEVIKRSGREMATLKNTTRMTVAAMEEGVRALGTDRVRLVFWFHG